MKWKLIISLLFLAHVTFSQDESKAVVNYLNYDPFLESDSAYSSPILPALGTTNEVGFKIAEDPKNNLKTLHIFPVSDLVGSFQTNYSESSLNAGVGVGITGQFTKQFYARFILTGNYLLFNKIQPEVFSLDHVNFWSNSNSNSSFGLQPRARISYSPYSFLNIQAGIDEHFIGQGNRSMLLGDYGTPYPFVQLKTKVWRIEVTNLYQFFKEFDGETKIPKYASTHFFNYNITDRLQLGIFESVIFSAKDTTTQRGYELAYVNPFLFYRPTEYGLGSQDRLQIGINASYEFNKVMLYSQLVIDEFILHELLKRTRWWGNKYGGQLGVKGKNSFANGNKLTWLAEINFARPFLYAHGSPSTVYGNQGRPLAHPLGANFIEVYTEATLKFKNRLSLNARVFYSKQGGFDGNNNLSYGKDIYVPYMNRPFDYGYKIGENGTVNRINFSVQGSYVLSKKIALEAFSRVGYEENNFSHGFSSKFFAMGGIRTNLWNERSFSF